MTKECPQTSVLRDDLISRDDALSLCDAYQYVEGVKMALQDLPAVHVAVKPLVWVRTGENRYSAKSADYRVITDGKGWAFCPEDWPPFYGYTYLTADDAKAAAQADYETRIRAALDVQPLSPTPVAASHTADPAAIREAALKEAAYVAINACLVPPDGGSPTEAESLVCEEAYRRILALIGEKK